MDIKKEIIERTLDAANIILLQGGTLRSIAEQLGTNRQTLSNNFKKVLPEIDPELSKQVNQKLLENKKSGVSKGGNALKMKREQAKKRMMH